MSNRAVCIYVHMVMSMQQYESKVKPCPGGNLRIACAPVHGNGDGGGHPSWEAGAIARVCRGGAACGAATRGSDAASSPRPPRSARRGYCEINLNVGCPSDRVQGGNFGACLMAEPDLVAACVAAMRARDRSGYGQMPYRNSDDQDLEALTPRFIETVAGAGCSTFIVHARKAWLKGLSPKENREIPPLDYRRVYRLKAARPDLAIVINGGIATLDEAEAHLAHVDGVMLGRARTRLPTCWPKSIAAFLIRLRCRSRDVMSC